MKTHRILTIVLCLFVCSHAPAKAQDMDTELTKLTENLAGLIKDHGSKKVTVLDFTDLDGNTSEVGKYAAEQLTVDFVMKKRDFSVLDRANLKKIMDEHKLTASGLVDPENAKKLGQFAGVDAMIFGKIIPAVGKVNVTATIVTTDTAEIIGGGKASFINDSAVQQLQTNTATGHNSLSGTGTGADLNDDTPKVVKTFGDFGVGLRSLILNKNGTYCLIMTLTNLSASKSLWVALSPRISIFDPNGNPFGRATPIALSCAQTHVQYAYGGARQEYFNPAVEIKPRDFHKVLIVFGSSEGRSATTGICNVQLEFLLGDDFVSGSARQTTSPSLVTKFEATESQAK
jgi:TolB-like protein